MNKIKIYKAENEPVLGYHKGSKERLDVEKTYNQMFNSKVNVPLYIGSEEILTESRKDILPPHDHKNIVGTFSQASEKHVNDAIENLIQNKSSWSNTPWEKRCDIFLKAADLLADKYRAKITAGTMIGQSKNIFQAEIDAACEFIDFLRFNVSYLTEIYNEQPIDGPGKSNHLEYRALEGFVYAVTPFNFTAIGGNLPTCMAMLGNTVIWKPSDKQIYSAKIIIDVLKEAGLPSGVINAVYGDPSMITEKILNHKEFSGIHFTGSTDVFNSFWGKIGANINNYKTYPKIVGETGGKDFIVAHQTANPKEVSTAIVRGAFEFQGQKCSAASRGYISKSIWGEVKEHLIEELSSISIGSPIDMENFVTAVISEVSFDRIVKYIENAKKSKNAQIVHGGGYDKSKGYFIEPTLIVVDDPNYITMREEIFGPVMTIYVYDDEKFNETLDLVDNTSKYALTGAILAKDRNIIEKVTKRLKNSAGNFYVNDKPTGAVVGKQPFGGARGSGTNDKAGSMLNLLRWVSPRLIKETFVTPTDYRYPFLEK